MCNFVAFVALVLCCATAVAKTETREAHLLPGMSTGSSESALKSLGNAFLSESGVLELRQLRLEGDFQVLYTPDAWPIKNIDAVRRSTSSIRLDLTVNFDEATGTYKLETRLPPHSQVKHVVVWCDSCDMGASETLHNTAAAFATMGDASGTVIVICRNSGLLLPTMSPVFETHTSRALLAACSETLTVNGAESTFDTCLDLSQDASTPFFVYASLEKASDGNTAIIRGGIRAKTLGWAGIAFPLPGAGMIGSSAVMVWPDNASPTGASVDGYMLKSYEIPELNAAKGSYKLIESAAALGDDALLTATFSAELSSWVKAPSSTPVDILFGLGAMEANGRLSAHSAADSTYGFGALDLKSFAKATDAAPTLAPAPAPALKPVATPAKAPAPAPTVETATVMEEKPPCSLLLDGQLRSFAACLPVEGIGKEFNLAWELTEDPENLDSSLLTMAMSAQATGYVSVGFPSSPGSMLDASAVILQTCRDCNSGAQIYEVYMSGYEQSDVNKASRLNLSKLVASVDEASDTMSGIFTVRLDGINSPRRALLAAELDAYNLIFAAGPVTSTGVALYHTTFGDSIVDVTQGGILDDAISTESKNEDAKVAHMWLSTIGWGVMVPLGILVARMLKPKSSAHEEQPSSKQGDANGAFIKADSPVPSFAWWFHLHRALQSLGFTLGTVGLALGFVATGGWDSPRQEVRVHRNLGMATTVLGMLQVAAVVWRPKPGTKLRTPWSLGHIWMGRVVAILAIANIYQGILEVEKLGAWAWAAYTGVLGAVVITALAAEVRHALFDKGAKQPATSSTNSIRVIDTETSASSMAKIACGQVQT